MRAHMHATSNLKLYMSPAIYDQAGSSPFCSRQVLAMRCVIQGDKDTALVLLAVTVGVSPAFWTYTGKIRRGDGPGTSLPFPAVGATRRTIIIQPPPVT
jgi:hypothetical protein